MPQDLSWLPEMVANLKRGGDDDRYPVDLDRVGEDVPLAQRAVIIHQPEDWPGGQSCRNDHSRWPCQLYRWGRAVLEAAGWSGADIDALGSAPSVWSWP